MISRTDNPLADFDRWEEEKERAIAKLPRCDYCNEPIQDDYCYDLDGEVICEDCLNRHFRKLTMDLMG